MIIERGEPHASESITGRTRLAIIGAVVVLAVAIGAVLGTLLVSGQGAALSRAADYVPRGAVMYMEVRLDLPGQQRANLRAILDRFPAVTADDLLTDALADTLDGALADGGAPFDYSTDVAPWFDGTVGLAMLDYPVISDPMQMQLPGFVALFGVRDAAAASDLGDAVRGELEAQGTAFSSADHNGVTVWTASIDAPAGMPMTGVGFAYAVAADQLILGNGASSVESALDTASDGQGLAGADEVERLLAALPDERIGVSVVNSAAIMAQVRAELEATQPDAAAALAPILDAAPPISVGAVSLAADAIMLDSVSGVPTGPVAPSNSGRDLAAWVAADAIVFADGGNIGASLEQGLAALKAAIAAGPESGGGVEGLAQVEAALGADLEELVSWIGSGAVTAGWDGEQPYLGLVLEAVDPAAAERRLAQLRALAELAAGDPSAGIEVTTETVAGTEVTTIHLGEPMTALAVPLDPALQYAIKGDMVLIGVGTRFVVGALTLDSGDSLAESDRYRSAIARFGGNESSGAFFVDLDALRQVVESAKGADAEPMYGLVRPNLAPFDYLAGVTRVEGDRVISRTGLVLH